MFQFILNKTFMYTAINAVLFTQYHVPHRIINPRTTHNSPKWIITQNNSTFMVFITISNQI